MADIIGSLLTLLDSLPISGWGVSEAGSDGEPKFTSAISLLQAYSYPLENYSPFDFNDFLINKIKPAQDACVNTVCCFLDKNGVRYHAVLNTRENPVLYTEEYSQKRAALKAGLGWIGKNTLLVTPNYGPRVRLSTLLVDLDLPLSPAGEMPGCGECTICVNCCPSLCLIGVNWKPGSTREDMIDISLCGEVNDSIQNCVCGACLLSCPIGAQNRLGTVICR